MHIYEVRPRRDGRGAGLISDALPFGRLWDGKRNAVSNAIGTRKVLLAIISTVGLRIWNSIQPKP